MEHFDVLVVGAGLSGICAGYYLQKRCPERSYAILEGRQALGGTWDLFRYPGIRSDSDMFTLGYSFRPWPENESIAEGPAILQYIEDTAREYGIDQKIRFGLRVKQASWSSEDARWTVTVEKVETGESVHLTCNFLFMCSGYYSYEHGYTPDFPGVDRFAGPIIHPQKWTDNIDYAGKRIVVIGSGATAMTLVPSLAEKAAHVTMLQRSPTYVISRPARDRLVAWMRRGLPQKLAARLARWKNVLLAMYFYNISKRRPEQVKAFLIKQIRKELGPDYDVETHFNPRYNPWDQRVCLVPDSDLFQVMKTGKVSVVTEQIETFTERGIQLCSGETLEADMIITATGLNLQFLGNVQLTIDGKPFVPNQAMTYKGAMFQDVPNLALTFGYTNASWTLKCELICGYVCKLLNYMAKHGYKQATPRLKDDSVQEVPFSALSSGYIQRSLHKLPKQGSKSPWRLHQNYILDTIGLKMGSIDDGSLEFGK